MKNYVVSSNLHAVEYQQLTNELIIDFNNGSSYVYSGVPAYVFHELMDAASKGRYFCKFIRMHYPYSRIV